jgi:hypothetical protein
MISKLYEKYKAENYQDLLAINPLSFILRKAELSHDLLPSEWSWLQQHQQLDRELLFVLMILNGVVLITPILYLTLLQNQFSQLQHKYKAIVHNEFNP